MCQYLWLKIKFIKVKFSPFLEISIFPVSMGTILRGRELEGRWRKEVGGRKLREGS